MGIIASSYYYYTSRTDDPDPVTTLTSREIFLVKSSWAPIKTNLTSFGIKLLLDLFRAYPDEQNNFPFKGVPLSELETSKKFHAHASNVMYSVDALIDNLHDSELLVNLLQKIGGNHYKNKVRSMSFWHVKEVFLTTFRTITNQETVAAWDKTLTVAFGVIGGILEQ